MKSNTKSNVLKPGPEVEPAKTEGQGLKVQPRVNQWFDRPHKIIKKYIN